MGLILIDKDSSFGERVKIYRNEKNKSRAQLSKESGISQYLIRKIENEDYRLGFDKMMILASILEIPADHVFKGNRFGYVLGHFYDGETVFGKLGPEKTYDRVQIRSCMNFDENEIFCITKDSCTYIAGTKKSKNSTEYVCVNDRGICHITKKPGKRKVVGYIISGAEEFITPIIFRKA